MKYGDAIGAMMSDPSTGFKHIQGSDPYFKANLLNEINKAKCSIATARIFIEFIEMKMEKGKEIRFDATMQEAAFFIGNGMGFDVTRYSENITNLDLAELQKIMSAKKNVD